MILCYAAAHCLNVSVLLRWCFTKHVCCCSLHIPCARCDKDLSQCERNNLRQDFWCACFQINF